jgi:hypothetical protein
MLRQRKSVWSDLCVWCRVALVRCVERKMCTGFIPAVLSHSSTTAASEYFRTLLCTMRSSLNPSKGLVLSVTLNCSCWAWSSPPTSLEDHFELSRNKSEDCSRILCPFVPDRRNNVAFPLSSVAYVKIVHISKVFCCIFSIREDFKKSEMSCLSFELHKWQRVLTG